MANDEELGAKVAELERIVRRLVSGDQLGSSTFGGTDEDDVESVPLNVTDALADANDASTAIPLLQDDIDEHGEAVSDLADQIDATMDELDARLELADTNLAVAREEIEEAQAAINTAFGTRVDGLSDDVDTAISAAGSAKTEAEAATDAAQAAAGLAGSLGQTFIQVSKPTGSRADPKNLWINISPDSNGVPKNQPNRYDSSIPDWVPITDAQAVAAAQTAATAVAAAQAAKDIADQANTAAGVAKTAADNANTAALQAAGIANGKGKVISQVSKPTGANAAAGNLWIRTTDNTPWVYDTTIPDWVQVTDQNATNAAAAAVQAQQAATAAANAASAAQATADSKPLILFSSTSGPSGTAPTGSTWFLWDSAKNIAGQWLQSGTLANPVWTPQQITSQVIANLDLGKLTAGSAAIATLVAQKIAASTANFQTANVSNLFVTSGATMSQAVIDFLFANVVQAKKITAGMIDVDSLNGITLTGTIVQTSATGKRTVLGDNVITFFGSDGTTAVKAGVIEGLPNGASGGMVHIGPAQGGGDGIYIGTRSLPFAGSVGCYADNAWIPALYVSSVYSAGTGKELVGDTQWQNLNVTAGNNDTTNPVQYRRLNGQVVLQGLITPTVVGQTIGQLPAGFRPGVARQMWLDRNGATQWVVRVQAGGNIALLGPSGGSGAINMGGFTPFPADN
ncbi:hypothetical protein [Curtobacterium sp. DN_7.5]|uniref:hypothetical protein n=1 Tax=Curtobacterium sp. DN_7.5 TaxID=3049047 RepID=UPI001F5803B0|nr:hypothetical protein [Curtobacterium sp. DN_7.5]